MSWPGHVLMHDRQIVIGVDLIGRNDAVFAVNLEEGDRDHEVTGELEGV